MNNGFLGFPAQAQAFPFATRPASKPGKLTYEIDFARLRPLSAVVGSGAGVSPGILPGMLVSMHGGCVPARDLTTVPGALWCRTAATGNPDAYLRQIPPGDFEAVLELEVMSVQTNGASHARCGIWAVDDASPGAGNQNLVGMDSAGLGKNFGVHVCTNWNNLGSMSWVIAAHSTRQWIRMRKAGATWTASFSNNGKFWTSPRSWTIQGVPTRIGFGCKTSGLDVGIEVAFYSFRIWEPTMPPGALDTITRLVTQ